MMTRVCPDCRMPLTPVDEYICDDSWRKVPFQPPKDDAA